MIGWAAATGGISLESIVLFLIIFMWTPPHFWALALYRARDYERAGVPMLPVVAGADETRKQIVIYSALLVMVAFLPALLQLGGSIYALSAIAAGSILLSLALTVHRVREGREADRAAQRLFAYSIVYLFVLFAVLLLEAAFGRYLSLTGVSLA
jgi:protoheme IX farnesyltransferase